MQICVAIWTLRCTQKCMIHWKHMNHTYTQQRDVLSYAVHSVHASALLSCTSPRKTAKATCASMPPLLSLPGALPAAGARGLRRSC